MKGKEWGGMEGEKEEFTSKDQMRLCLPFHSTSLRKAVSAMQGHSPTPIGSSFKFLSVCHGDFTPLVYALHRNIHN